MNFLTPNTHTMKKTLIPFLGIVLLCIVHSCVKPRTDNINYFKNHLSTGVDTSGAVVVNEFVATGSTLANEYGLATDWVELYNTGDSAINFATNNYYITDDSTKPDKFVINGLSIPGKGFLVLFCDDSAKIITQVHTNFGLSKSGEFIGLFRKNLAGNFDTLTWHPFGNQNTNISEGRYPDGGNSWTNFTVPTPGAPNHL